MVAGVALACGGDGSEGPRGDAGLDAPDGAPERDVGAGAADAAVVPRGSRVLGVAVAIDDTDFPTSAQTARDAGSQTTSVTFAWDEVERPYDAGATDSGDPDAAAAPTTLFNPGLHVVNLVLADRRLEAMLAVEAFDVGGSRVPADLAGRSLDDPAVEARYDALLDYVFSQIGDTPVTALLVATGADAWIETDAQRAAPFAAFVTHAAAHARALRPGLDVGFTVDDLDRTALRSAQLAASWSASDFAGFDYVPAAAVARGDAPSAIVAADFDRMRTSAPAGKPIVLRSAGYPSAPAAGPAASEAAQADFVSSVFEAWDRSPERFSAIVFRELVDATSEDATEVAARRGRSDAPFVALVQSLGMRARDGREKQAFGVVRHEARARGW